MKQVEVEDVHLDKSEMKLSRYAKETIKLKLVRKMENELNNYKSDDSTIIRYTL
jgi:hypothetical protein